MTWLMTLAGPVGAQDVVRYRTRTAKGDWPILEAKGTIESDSLAGVKLSGNLIAANNIVDIDYEMPGAIRIDAREARQAEDSRKIEEAIRKYRALAASPSASNNKALKRFFEYKVVTLTAAKADAGPAELRAAIAALTKWIQDHPESWQRTAASRLLARLQLDSDPPNVEAAKKVYEDLAGAPGAGTVLKADCQFAIVDLYLTQNKQSQAKQHLDTISAGDPRLPAYRIACRAESANAESTEKQLEELLAKADDSVKPTIYNLLGDCRRREPKKEKDALFAYLWVALIYNQDAAETAKAQDRIAELFKKMGQEERAKNYRDKARGRG
jgi:hypothetical protein